MNAPNRARRVGLDPLQARFALRVVACLDERSQATSHDYTERLRVSRDQAVQRARERRLAAATAAKSAGAQDSPPSWWLRLASVTPLLLLVLGLAFIQDLHQQAEIRAAADVDAALLADDLPPEAYRDPGFVAYLKLREP